MEIDCLILPTTRFGVADLLDIDIFLDESYFTFSNAIHTCSGIVPLRLSTSKDITDVNKIYLILIYISPINNNHFK